jgi:hypothetical protein
MMERLGCTLAEAPIVYGWHSVAVWARHLPQGSAVWRAKHREEAAYAGDYQRALILADIFDAIVHAGRVAAESNGAKFHTNPKPYPRPGARDEAEHFGSGGIPVSEFDAWFYSED